MDWPATVVQVSDDGWDALIGQGVPVFVDFWAPWCGPCRVLGPSVEELAPAYRGRAIIAKLNVDDNPIVPQRYGITSIPTLLMFNGGELIDRMVGAAPKSTLEYFINRNLQAA